VNIFPQTLQLNCEQIW